MKVTSDVKQKFHPTTLSIAFETPEELASFYLYVNLSPAIVADGNERPGMRAKRRMTEIWCETEELIRKITGTNNVGGWARENGLEERDRA